MKKCTRCGFQLEPVDIKANKCPVCEKTIDPRRNGEDARVKMKTDERVKRPE
jgi:predicted Zn-ribbon and HTH transcriptional regulator